MTGDKLRFRFAKTGHLRLLSHHDLMRCLERMLRRADVPFKSTAGFHPTPRLVFALSLPLGVVGRDEAVELELTRPCDADETLGRLNAQAPDGLTFTRDGRYAYPSTGDVIVRLGTPLYLLLLRDAHRRQPEWRRGLFHHYHSDRPGERPRVSGPSLATAPAGGRPRTASAR